MEHSNAEGSGASFNGVRHYANAMDEIFEANSGEGLGAVQTSNLHVEGVMDRAMPYSDQDDSDYIENILAPFEETHEFFEDLECRFTVSAMVADAVTNGMVRAVLEESSEALAVKEAEILALNDKLEDRDAKLWELEETLQFKQEELDVCIAESKSDLDRLVLDFMHEKERMQRRLHETETVLVEKERELATKSERMLAMATELEVDRNKIMIMEERIQTMQNEKTLSDKNISTLVGELERAKAERESVRSSIRKEVLKSEPELMERSQQEENVERVVSERNEPIAFVARSISFLERPNYELVQNAQELELAKREETEEQMVRQQIERCVSNSIYEGYMLELALVRDTIGRDRLHSGIDIYNFQQEIGHLKKDFEAELVEKMREVSDLAEELEQSKLCNELQSSVIVGNELQSSEFLDYNLSGIHLHKIDAEFNKLHAKFLQLAFKLDSFEASFHQIQSWIVSFQEKLLEQQWQKKFEDEIIALVLRNFLNDLDGQFETKEHKELTQLSTVQARWDEGRLALMNEISNLRQELQHLRIEEPVKSSFISDVGTNGFQVLSRFTQDVRNEEATDAQRKERDTRRLSASQFSTGTSRMENSYATYTTGKITGHSIRESDMPEHNLTETVDIQESPLKSMTKEQLLIHFKRVEAELKRDMECIVEEKTEEIYRLKRDLLREKDSFHSRKDKELAALKKKIAEIIRMLNKFDEENDRLSASLRLEFQNYEMVCTLKDGLQAENRRLVNILRQKENELKALSDKLSDALRRDTECSSTETNLLKQISELQSEKEDIDLQNRNEIQILRAVFEETVKEKEISLNSVLKEQEEIMKQKLLLEDMIHEKDTALKLSVMEKEEQEQKLVLMETLIEEKEKVLGSVPRELEDVEEIKKQKDLLALALKECEDLKKQKAYLEIILQIKDSTIDSAVREQEELKKHITLLREGMEEKDDRLKMAVGHLEEAMEEKKTLEIIIEERKNALCLQMQKEEEQRKRLEAIIAEREDALTSGRINIEKYAKAIVSLEETLKLNQSSLEMAMRGKEEEEHRRNLLEVEVQKLKDAIKNMQGGMETAQKQNKMEVEQCVRNSMDAALELECRVTENIQDKILRLEGVKQQLKKLCEQANLVVKRESYYRGNFGKKYCNLQKAEVEVDLLGDEVENLLSLLEKVYFALDHYLPILQYYPGIPELLKLIRRELIAQVDSERQLCKPCE